MVKTGVESRAASAQPAPVRRRRPCEGIGGDARTSTGGFCPDLGEYAVTRNHERKASFALHLKLLVKSQEIKF